jgi:histone H3/H4
VPTGRAAHRAQVRQAQTGRQAAGHTVGHRLRQQRLPAVRHAHHARSAVDHAAEEVAVAVFHRAAVQAAAHAQRQLVAAGVDGQVQLQLQGGQHTGQRVVEDRVDAVAGALDDTAAVRLHGRLANRVVPRQRQAHALGLALPQARAAFDVGEEKGGERRGCRHAAISRLGGVGCRPAGAHCAVSLDGGPLPVRRL